MLGNKTYLDLILSEPYNLKTYYMGLVDEYNRQNYYEGMLRVIDPKGKEVAFSIRVTTRNISVSGWNPGHISG